jgi:colicin import membrane protein
MALLGALTLTNEVAATQLKSKHQMHNQVDASGIFSTMIDQVTAPERAAEERHKATTRKQQQLAAAEKEY